MDYQAYHKGNSQINNLVIGCLVFRKIKAVHYPNQVVKLIKKYGEIINPVNQWFKLILWQNYQKLYQPGFTIPLHRCTFNFLKCDGVKPVIFLN
jgi:hypothetical protein